MDSFYTGPQAAGVAGISYDTLDYWVKCGLISPSFSLSLSRKCRSYYSFSDIVIVATLKALRDRGISLQKIKKAKTELWKRIGMSLEQGIRGGVIVADGKDVLAVLYTLDDAIQILSLLRGGQMFLPLDNIVVEIENKLMQMYPEETVRVPMAILNGKVANHER